jgi:hypothetical protein
VAEAGSGADDKFGVVGIPVAQFCHGCAVTSEVTIIVLVVDDDGDGAQEGIADCSLRVVVQDPVEYI